MTEKKNKKNNFMRYYKIIIKFNKTEKNNVTFHVTDNITRRL